jgi:probable F420-dependent oxidoreductase
MHIGVAPHPLWPIEQRDLEQVLDTVRAIERLGFDHMIMGSHVLAGDLGFTLDPIVTLAAAAGATSRIRLATSVLILPLFNPVIVAHQAATLDLLSRGRLILGVGIGWDRDEFATVGIPFNERGIRTDEHLVVMKRLWRAEASDFAGQFTSFRDARLGVAPFAQGGPPIWVGGDSDAALRRALRFAHGWHGALDHQGVPTLKRRLERLAHDEDRDPTTLALGSVCFLTPPGIPQVRQSPGRPLGGPTPTTQSVLEDIGLLEQAGVASCSLWMPIAQPAFADALDWVAETILPSSGIPTEAVGSEPHE